MPNLLPDHPNGLKWTKYVLRSLDSLEIGIVYK